LIFASETPDSQRHSVSGLSGASLADRNDVPTGPKMSMNDRQWFAVQTWPRYEKKVAAELHNKTIDVFLPLEASVRQWSDRRRVVELPLFPTYLFVRIPERLDSRIPVLRTNGVSSFVGMRGAGTPIPENEIESVRAILKRGVAFQNSPFPRAGDRVRLRGGSLDGVEGILVENNGDRSLIVSINIIQRSLAVRVAGYGVEAA
jgi:transcription antitermination factor NusG